MSCWDSIMLAQLMELPEVHGLSVMRLKKGDEEL